MGTEINRAIDSNGGKFSYDVVMGNKFFDQVVNETLRKYPPLETTMRVTTQDYTVPGTTHCIPSKVTVQIPIYAIHHDPAYYPDPDRFDPDRFTAEECKKRPPYTFLPFGDGPRICIGMRFGLMQVKVGLASLLRDFRFKPSVKTPERIVFDPKSFILSPVGGNHLQVESKMDLLSYVLTAFVFIVSIAYLYVRSRHNFWRDRGFAYTRKKPHLLYGHMEDSFTKKHTAYINQEMYQDLKSRGEQIGGMSFFIIPGLIAVDPELVKTILVKDFNVFHDRGVFNDAKADPLSAHLFALEGKEWRVLRQKLTPTFTSGRMKQMFGTIQLVADEFLKYMNEHCHQEIEMKDVLARFTTDVIGTCAFGIECNTLKNPDSDFLKYGNKVFEQDVLLMAKFVFASMFKGFAKKIGVKLTDEGVERFFLEVVRDTVQYREMNQVQRNDFMNLLLQIKNNGSLDELDGGAKSFAKGGGAGMTLNELAAQVFIFFVAGFETSSTTMNFCLYELAKNPDIQERLREEINRAIEDNDGKVTYDVVMNIQYLDNVINETLRKYPPVESLTRVPLRDYTIPGTKLVIPKDTLIQIPVYALQRDEEHFPNPEQFNPDRFLPEEVKQRHPYVYLPFGEGPRICIGLRFGVMQAKLGLITLLRNFRFSPSSRTPSKIVFDPKSFILSPNTGNYLKVDKI
uniref:Cytochrome P450 n=1 Tax=Anopheles farauti TaxID=69004 RepID=A0A182QU57_9DIPT